jgi:hypothetical protein
VNKKSTPFQPLPEFAHFTPAELETIHEHLRTHTYRESAEYLLQTHGIAITESRLYRYRSRLDLADHLQLAQDNTPAIENLLHFFAGRAVDLSPSGRQLILERALLLAANPDTAPSLLIQLHRLFTYEDRRAALEHRMHIAERRENTRERLALIAQRRQRFLEKKYEKANKPEATVEELQLALREQFGCFPPVTPYEPKPRPDKTAAHTHSTSESSESSESSKFDHSNECRAYTECSGDRESNAVPDPTADPSFSSASSAVNQPPVEPTPPMPPTPLDPEALAAAVDTYTVSRAHEYHAHYNNYDPKGGPYTPPPYITRYRRCPCGQDTPCPFHENEEFGKFPDWFWTKSPYSFDYIECLNERNLPYRRPSELLA